MNRDNSYLIGNQFAKGSKPNLGSFQKGHPAWNRGLTGIHLSPETEFHKGQKPIIHFDIGTIVQRIHKGDGGTRNWIKIAEPNKWEEYSKYLWKKHFGRIIPGDIIHHINGVKTGDRIENLLALPRSHHPIFHSRWGLKPFTEEQVTYYISRYGSFWKLARMIFEAQVSLEIPKEVPKQEGLL